MQITNHYVPTHIGNGSRPDHAAKAAGKPQQFDVPTVDTEPATETDIPTAVAPTEETENGHRPGRSVAHQARMHLAQLSGLDGHNFGWLVSQIARGMFDVAAYTTDDTTDGENPDGTVDGTDVIDGDGTTTPVDETVVTDETADAAPTPETEGEGEGTDPVASLVDTLIEETAESSTAEETIDPIVDLVDTLLDDNDNEDDREVT